MSEEQPSPMQFVSQDDVQGRLRLFRYGIIAITVITFLVTLVAPYAWASSFMSTVEDFTVNIADFIVPALIAGVIAAVLGVVSYFVYMTVLKRTMGE